MFILSPGCISAMAVKIPFFIFKLLTLDRLSHVGVATIVAKSKAPLKERLSCTRTPDA